jgi:hypothetical protein
MRSAARKFCALLELNELPEPVAYEAALDKWTDQLQHKFPRKGQCWGVARKCLNIFMRNASYNVHLRNKYPRLKLLERFLEVPLDSNTANGLLGEKGAADFGLPRWDTVIGLEPEENQKYQQWALKVAKRKGILRVHVDLLYFPFP